MVRVGRLTTAANPCGEPTIYHEATVAEDSDIADKIVKWAKSSQSGARIEAMIKLARSEWPIPTSDTKEKLPVQTTLRNDSRASALRKCLRTRGLASSRPFR